MNATIMLEVVRVEHRERMRKAERDRMCREARRAGRSRSRRGLLALLGRS